MSKQANPTIIGIFVLGAVCIALLGITVFTSGKWFSEKSEFVIYFNESVNGLSIGALVKMQGVPIGKVTDIHVQLEPEPRRILTPVFIEIDHEKCKLLLQFKEFNGDKTMMEQLIKNGLRMQLQYTSIVTGQLYIETLLKPDSPMTLTHLNKDYVELPAITSSSQEVKKNVTDVMREIQNINIRELFAELLVTVRNFKEITGSEDTRMAIHGLSTSLVELQGILASFNQRSESIALHTERTLKYSSSIMKKMDLAVEPLFADMQQTLANTDMTLKQFQLSANSVGEAFNKDAQLQQNLNSTLIELRRSAKSMRFLADYLERHPESLIQGKHN
ncbi:paraquat-inducible protein B [Bathymodiolus platifrons methanotrophic gill symbiont]|uniref:MlaD family protein n=1 Tax=Bathymodiolus platifrons methanotrophic gill symbiont TaxID=113268 RepID=UPI000B40FDB6|nr:MlaD family protein [Bathymodiolus platifrons methanotrophic gill symbiont]MCK5869844.1 MCE family protein [Methyloprofundus sp.]TXK98132.1 MCE family protein [Methylococcaceae bacterium CS4]TXK99620.1 MCE family protein [Methylococcaceae bacterium CS5]TXL05279.1 MCE family protein [Methylococcaceae bacterium CS1]TXL08010.1 MCE family protein [Methylococcaceae bacterium CS3]TXL11814.1 MCE family protein [Methylococcaceae bacterium CS2]